MSFSRLLATLAAVAVGSSLPIEAYAQPVETVLYAFTGGSDGGFPSATLLADTTGPGHTLRGLYGTTNAGGLSTCSVPYDQCGTVFKLTPPQIGQTAWTETTKWAFTGGADGNYPFWAGLSAPSRRVTRDTPLYGTTWLPGGSGNGTVFAVTGKKLTTLWAFTGGADGADPVEGQVAIDCAGNLYVGASGSGVGAGGNGTVIELTPPANGHNTWTETTIWTFSGGNDGAVPFGLVIDDKGALYVTVDGGGATGKGAIVKLTPPAQDQTAWTEQTLWSFQGGSDGAYPQGPVTFGKDGTLYGTTFAGGGNPSCNQCGTVYRLAPPKPGKAGWTEKILWHFSGGQDGAQPINGVILDRTGVVYGTAAFGGTAQGQGAAFKLQPPGPGQTEWSETTLWVFSGGSDGGLPYASLTPDKSGTLYGATVQGGLVTYGCCGVVFSLTGTGYVP